MKKYLTEVETAVRLIKPVKKPSKWKAENYIGAGRSALSFFDVKIPDVRTTFKRGFSFYDRKTRVFESKHLEIFDYIWKHSMNFETLLICHYYVRAIPFSARKENRKLLFTWLSKVDNWALSDELSHTFSELLEDDPSLIKYFRKWNRSQNPWERRQSIVGLLFYVRFRKSKYLSWSQIKLFVDPLLDDRDYYVQKGVGWTLREAYTWYPKPVFSYIKSNCLRIDPSAWYACTERMSSKEKLTLKKKRQERVHGKRG